MHRAIAAFAAVMILFGANVVSQAVEKQNPGTQGGGGGSTTPAAGSTTTAPAAPAKTSPSKTQTAAQQCSTQCRGSCGNTAAPAGDPTIAALQNGAGLDTGHTPQAAGACVQYKQCMASCLNAKH